MVAGGWRRTAKLHTTALEMQSEKIAKGYREIGVGPLTSKDVWPCTSSGCILKDFKPWQLPVLSECMYMNQSSQRWPYWPCFWLLCLHREWVVYYLPWHFWTHQMWRTNPFPHSFVSKDFGGRCVCLLCFCTFHFLLFVYFKWIYSL